MPSVTSAAACVTRRRLTQGGEGHDPAIAAVVCAHDDPGVLDRDKDHQRPEDERDDAVDARRGGPGGIGVRGEDDLLGVERAGPDVPIDDPQRPEREDRPARVGDHVAVVVGGGAQRVGRLGAPRGRWTHRPVAELVCGLVEVAAGGGHLTADVRPALVNGALRIGAPT